MDTYDVDMLISRVVDGEAEAKDWAALESLAERDAAVWRELAMAVRLNHQLNAEVASETGLARGVDLDPAELEHASTQSAERSLADRWRRVGAWGGWIAAALMIAVLGRAGLNRQPSVPVNAAGVGLAPAEYLSSYLESGKQDGTVVGEMPRKLLLDTTPAEDGGVYVLYVRQIVERVKVDDLYRISVDELGNPTPVKLPEGTKNPARVPPAM
ncbi:MAG: hypothetical protein ACOYN0_09660 [Phycisphaerales bacterium]